APELVRLLVQGFELVAKEEEWVHLSALGSALRQLDPAFDPRTYGHARLVSLIRSYPQTFALKRDNSNRPPTWLVALTGQQKDADDS
ncbi:MAG: Maebl, partial [Dehalococcoidia bacterium]|nr:Maebl [Dehalococcoidia bacterium]